MADTDDDWGWLEDREDRAKAAICGVLEDAYPHADLEYAATTARVFREQVADAILAALDDASARKGVPALAVGPKRVGVLVEADDAAALRGVLDSMGRDLRNVTATHFARRGAALFRLSASLKDASLAASTGVPVAAITPSLPARAELASSPTLPNVGTSSAVDNDAEDDPHGAQLDAVYSAILEDSMASGEGIDLLDADQFDMVARSILAVLGLPGGNDPSAAYPDASLKTIERLKAITGNQHAPPPTESAAWVSDLVSIERSSNLSGGYVQAALTDEQQRTGPIAWDYEIYQGDDSDLGSLADLSIDARGWVNLESSARLESGTGLVRELGRAISWCVDDAKGRFADAQAKREASP